jgi:hypothetical protein
MLGGMKYMTRAALFSLVWLMASTGFAAGWMKVTVFNGAGDVVFRGTTGSEGAFGTGVLPSGRYIVQFNSNTGEVKGHQYGLVISAGLKKVVAHTVAGEQFLGGGVAMRIEAGSGSKITGQIGAALATRVDPKTGKMLVWLRPRVGSNMPGRWVPDDSPLFVATSSAGEIRMDTIRKWQDHGDMGL